MSEADALSGKLTNSGHELLQRVYFEDTDFSGLVYHARYLHFLERGRSDFLRLLGIHHRALAAEALAFAVRRMDIDFLRPAHIDDVLRVLSVAANVTGVRIELDQKLFREAEILVQARVTVVLIEGGGRPARLPASVREAFGRGGALRAGRAR